MKSPKGFFILILLYFIILFVWERLNQTPYFLQHNALMIKLRTLFLIGAGIGIMALTLEKTAFKRFLIFYAILWGSYFLIKVLMSIIGEVAINGTVFNSGNILMHYNDVTKIITPVPFLLFWLANRVFSNAFQKAHSLNDRQSGQ